MSDILERVVTLAGPLYAFALAAFVILVVVHRLLGAQLQGLEDAGQPQKATGASDAV